MKKDWEKRVNGFLAWVLPFWILCTVANIITGIVLPHIGSWNAVLSGVIIGAVMSYITITVLKPVTTRLEKWLESKPGGNGQGNGSEELL